MVLGLDISTSVIGWCVMQSIDKVVDAGYIDFRKFEEDKTITSIFKKVDVAIPELLIICKKNKVKNIVIETPIGMATGKNINSAIILNRFNFIIGYTLYSEGFPIRYEASQKARKKLLGNDYIVWFKLPSGDTKKEYITNLVKKNIEQFVKFEKRPKATEKWKQHLYDVADAYVMAKSFFV